MPLFSKDKQCLKILTLASKTKFDEGRYMLSFDVMKSKNCDEVRVKRGREPEVYEELPYLGGTRSSDIEMELSSKKCCFEFNVEGALKPATSLQKGENMLEYNSSNTDNRRHLYLTPTYDETSQGVAFIRFWYSKEVKHTVTVCDVPIIRISSASINDDGVDSSTANTVDAGPSVSTLRTPTVRATGSPISSAGNEATPMPPNSAQDDGNVTSGDLSDDESAYDNILSEPSLQCLVDVMAPQDSRKLLIYLGIPNDVIKQKEKNNPNAIEAALFECFLTWKSSSKEKTKAYRYKMLLAKLADIGRNDIKLSIEKVFPKNRELQKSDFKQ